MSTTEAEFIMMQLAAFSFVCFSIAFGIIGVMLKRKANGELPPRVKRHPNGRVIRNARG
jgi:hypothetical protein